MKTKDVKIGGSYAAKVSGNLVSVIIDRENPHGGWDATNQSTGKRVRIKSPRRLRCALQCATKQGISPTEKNTNQEDTMNEPVEQQANQEDTMNEPVEQQASQEDTQAEHAKIAESVAKLECEQLTEINREKYDQSECGVVNCHAEPSMTHLGKPLCQKHWDAHCRREEEWAVMENSEKNRKPDLPGGDVAAMNAASGDTSNQNAEQAESESDVMAKKSANPNSKKSRKPREPKAAKAANAPKEPHDKKVSAIDAAAAVLKNRTNPMCCKDLIVAMQEKGLWTSPGGKTPWATLYSAISREIETKGKESRFVKTDRGLFAHAG